MQDPTVASSSSLVNYEANSLLPSTKTKITPKAKKSKTSDKNLEVDRGEWSVIDRGGERDTFASVDVDHDENGDGEDYWLSTKTKSVTKKKVPVKGTISKPFLNISQARLALTRAVL